MSVFNIFLVWLKLYQILYSKGLGRYLLCEDCLEKKIDFFVLVNYLAFGQNVMLPEKKSHKWRTEEQQSDLSITILFNSARIRTTK